MASDGGSVTRGRDILLLFLGPVIIVILIAASFSAELALREVIIMTGFGIVLASGWLRVLGRLRGSFHRLLVPTIAAIGFLAMGAGCVWTGFAGLEGLQPRAHGTERLLPIIGLALAGLGIGLWSWAFAAHRKRDKSARRQKSKGV